MADLPDDLERLENIAANLRARLARIEDRIRRLKDAQWREFQKERACRLEDPMTADSLTVQEWGGEWRRMEGLGHPARGVVVDHGLHSKPVVDHEAANLRDNAAGVTPAPATQPHDWREGLGYWQCKRCGIVSHSGQENACTAGVTEALAPDTRKPWERSDWTCARARVDRDGMHCPEDKCADCPNRARGVSPTRGGKPE